MNKKIRDQINLHVNMLLRRNRPESGYMTPYLYKIVKQVCRDELGFATQAHCTPSGRLYATRRKD